MRDWQLEDPADVVKSSRYQSFTEVEMLALLHLKTTKTTLEELRLPRPRPENYSRSVADWHNDLFSHFCRGAYETFIGLLRELPQKCFVFAFDECTQLGKFFPSEDRGPHVGMSLIALQCIIKSFDAFSVKDVIIWFLLLDTSSSIPNLHPGGPDAPSVRFNEGYIPLPPWPYVGFNQLVPKGHSESFKIPSDALHLRHLKVYGRPVSNDTLTILLLHSTLTDRLGMELA